MIGDFLANRLKKSIEKNLKKSTLTDETVQETLREIRLALLEADVNNAVVKDFIKAVEAKAKGEYINDGLNASQMMIKIVHEELINIFGKTAYELNLLAKPAVIMMVGLQGSGKTTTTGKIAKLIEKKYHKKPLLVACDIYRPAAIDQLKTIGQNLGVEVFERGTQNPVLTAQQAVEYAKEHKHDVVLLDTAGRLHIDENLMQELKEIKNNVSPSEILIVVDGMTGQDIINVASEFNDLLKLTGVVVTKLDGDARGGAALSITHLTKLPISFIGTGEGMSNLQIFYPDRMADRILGMGDVQTLFEKAKDVIDERDMKKTMNRMMMGQFDLQDLLNQMRQISKMGKMGGLMKLIPGMPKVSDEKIADAERKLKVTEVLLSSMTIKERREPRLLKHLSRKNRIIKGSGRSEKEYNELINQFEKTKKQVDEIARQIKSGRMPNIPGMGGLGFN
ncbi:signal recognition particle protein [Spiroplasma chrysopicola]|uniref:Signal recognition particle protein n=1 Tax=Spiroplasma chrysopicola DF-1 TaxID=1276227 RepID=R4U336_9MOLU|nr:signal recognition particle protein [Spiroplasma chrysopicola]AGM24903.1 signal recognition particle [Spiroplasma chrysopicola DF-1]